ncbi:MAG: ABC transporter ATP-binding protein [Planctomycetes bacterium]|nr:ABC transporter ATP-binding protein [Planctomycetota bacterium]
MERRSFWSFAARMMRYRWLLLTAVLCALVSAGGLGAGFLGVKPVLEIVVGEPLLDDAGERLLKADGTLAERDLAYFAHQFNSVAPAALVVPEEWLARLPTGEFTAVMWIMVGLAGLTLMGGAANFGHQYFALTVVHRTITNIRRESFHNVIRQPLKNVLADGTSDTVSRIVNDSNALMTGFTALVSKSLAQTSKGMAAFIAALIIDWRLPVAVVPMSIILYIIIRRLGKRIRRASRSALQSQSRLLGATNEALQGLRVVKVHTTERYEAGRFHRLNKQVMRQLLQARTARALSSPLVEVLSVLALGAVTIVATKLILTGFLEPANFAVSIAALFAAGASLKPLAGLYNDIQAAEPAARRLAELLERDPEPGHAAGMPKLPRHEKSIRFEQVTFTYPRAAIPAIKNIDLVIRHGETVAIVGPNGSGKTTLLALVPRLFDPDQPTDGEAHGRVLLDGRDIRDYSVRSLRRQIGVVTQETILFSGTIRSNIAYGAEGVTEEKIVRAATRARAHEFIEKMSGGYDTIVGEQGLTLSGGQRQRLAIARAVLRDPAILILDEATSMIDADSEAKIAEAIADFSDGRTCLIVAHRLSTVVNADRIIVMDQGEIVDEGTHEQLLDRCETYRLIARTQLVRGAPVE